MLVAMKLLKLLDIRDIHSYSYTMMKNVTTPTHAHYVALNAQLNKWNNRIIRQCWVIR